MGAIGAFFGTAGTFLGGAKFWIAGIVIASLLAFGAGYYKATSSVESKLIAAQVENFNKGMAVQKNFDDEVFEIASTDFDKRHRSDVLRAKKLQDILSNLPVIVPRNAACVVSPEAMKKLNEVVNEAP